MRGSRLAPAALGALLCLFGCAHYQVNPRLAAADRSAGYRLSNLPASGANTDSLFVILAFSGGGTRAAALSYGVLEQLAKTQVYWEGQVRSLLSEVDVISSVSGGSFTAAYYAPYGDKIFKDKDFERRFLKRDIQGRLVRNLFYPWNFLRLPSPYFDRIDMAAEIYSRDLFDHKTYAELLRKHARPYLILNATDMTLGARFEFTQDQFDPICSDLSGVPIARAVAASSAFPGLLSPLTLRSYAQTCSYKVPDWYANALEDRDHNPPRYAEAQTLVAYMDTRNKQFIHLLDGGISDNIGLRAPIWSLISPDPSWSVLRMHDDGTVKKVVLITVNARPQARADWDLKESAPGLISTLQTSAETPIDHYSFETVELLRNNVDLQLQEEQTFAACNEILHKNCPSVQFPVPAPRPFDIHRIQVSFDALPEAHRRFFQSLPTNFNLPAQVVDCLRGAGATLLVESLDFNALLDEFDQAARAAGVQPPPRAPAPGYPWPCGQK
ncbi:MAG TPA: patatin-like phospholipase family protein [Thermoanaerobaculia bacterium]|nr:patatin-like phospholipase family protein [Thermoanaerobaculia bacterium]